MTVQILSDLEREMSVMVDDELGRAFGYVTSGASHREMLEVFLSALPVHPGAFLPHELDRLWDEFIKTAHEVLPPTDAADGPPADAEHVEAVTVEGGPPPPAEKAGQSEPPPETPTAPPPDTPQEAPQAPPQEVDCFNCNGTGSMSHDGSRCPVCNGTGKLLVSPSSAAPSS